VLAVRGRKILRMVTIPGYLIQKDLYRVSIIFKNLKHENVIKMKNKPYPALLRPSNLSNEIKKRVQKSRETIPLKLLGPSSMPYALYAVSYEVSYSQFTRDIVPLIYPRFDSKLFRFCFVQ
jgi:hypothetical protein